MKNYCGFCIQAAFWNCIFRSKVTKKLFICIRWLTRQWMYFLLPIFEALKKKKKHSSIKFIFSFFNKKACRIAIRSLNLKPKAVQPTNVYKGVLNIRLRHAFHRLPTFLTYLACYWKCKTMRKTKVEQGFEDSF